MTLLLPSSSWLRKLPNKSGCDYACAAKCDIHERALWSGCKIRMCNGCKEMRVSEKDHENWEKKKRD